LRVPEVVFGRGEDDGGDGEDFQSLLDHGADVLATRMSAQQAAELGEKFPLARYNSIGRTFRIPQNDVNKIIRRLTGKRRRHTRVPATDDTMGRVTIVTAGTSDLPVAEEARETALWTGASVRLISDVGVAGPHRLTANLTELQDAHAVVVVAGMEGALPSVVGVTWLAL